MRNPYNFVAFVLLILVTFWSCEIEEDYSPPNYITFDASQKDFTVNENSSGSLEVTVFSANTTSSDRSFEININESTTLNTEAFEVPANIIIPADSNEATFTIGIKDSNIDNSGETLVLSLESNNELHTGEPLTINIFKLCEIKMEDYVGDFSGSGSWNEIFGYTTEVETFYNEEDELMINGLLFQWFQDWWGEEIVKNDPIKMEIDEETGQITIPEQFYIESIYDGETQPAYNLKGSGQINACEKTMTIFPVLIQNGTELTGTNWNGGVRFKETIQLSDAEDTEM